MLEILKIIQVIISVLLVLIILLQQKKSSLNLTTFGNEGVGKFEKRGPEKILHNTTIILAALFVVNSLLYFFMA